MTDFNPAFFRFSVLFATAGAPNAEARPMTRDDEAFEAIVGEAFQLRAEVSAGTFLGGVRSAPAGSNPELAWSGNSFTPDVPGVYELTCSNGANGPITFRVVAFPPQALTFPSVADKNACRREPSSAYPVLERSPREKRLLLRRIASGAFGNFSAAAFAAMTASQPVPVGVDFSKA